MVRAMSSEPEINRSSEEEEEVEWRSVRECYRAEWSSLMRKGSNQDFELEWSVLSWDRKAPGNGISIIWKQVSGLWV